MSAAIPDAISPETFAKAYGWSEKRVRRVARKLGACRVLGNRMMLLPQDIHVILEWSKPCPSSCLNVKPSGITEARLPAVDYAARLRQRTENSRRELRPRSKDASTNVVLMDRKKS